jgi:hypothetical protein
MSFGELFGVAIVVTAIVGFKRGWLAAGYCTVIYIVLWISVAVVGWLLEETTTK